MHTHDQFAQSKFSTDVTPLKQSRVIYFISSQGSGLASVNAQQSSGTGDILQQTEGFHRGTVFALEALADYQGISFAVGTCQFCQTHDGHQLLAANIPGALPAYQLPVVGKLPSSPPARWVTASSSPGNFQEKPQQIFSKKKNDISEFPSHFQNSRADESEPFSWEHNVQRPHHLRVVTSFPCTSFFSRKEK